VGREDRGLTGCRDKCVVVRHCRVIDECVDDHGGEFLSVCFVLLLTITR